MLGWSLSLVRAWRSVTVWGSARVPMLLRRRSPSVEMKYRRPIFQHTTHWDLICFDFVPRRRPPQRGSARHSRPRHTRITRCKVRISTLSSVHTCTCTLLTFVATKNALIYLNLFDFFALNKIKFYWSFMICFRLSKHILDTNLCQRLKNMILWTLHGECGSVSPMNWFDWQSKTVAILNVAVIYSRLNPNTQNIYPMTHEFESNSVDNVISSRLWYYDLGCSSRSVFLCSSTISPRSSPDV